MYFIYSVCFQKSGRKFTKKKIIIRILLKKVLNEINYQFLDACYSLLVVFNITNNQQQATSTRQPVTLILFTFYLYLMSCLSRIK